MGFVDSVVAVAHAAMDFPLRDAGRLASVRGNQRRRSLRPSAAGRLGSATTGSVSPGASVLPSVDEHYSLERRSLTQEQVARHRCDEQASTPENTP